MNAIEQPQFSDIASLVYARTGIQPEDANLVGKHATFFPDAIETLTEHTSQCVADMVGGLAYPGVGNYASMIETMLLYHGNGDTRVLPREMLAHVIAPAQYPYPELFFGDHTPMQIQTAKREAAAWILRDAMVYLEPLGEGQYERNLLVDTGLIERRLKSGVLATPTIIVYQGKRIWALPIPKMLSSAGATTSDGAYLALLGDDINTGFSVSWMQSGAAIPDILAVLEARQRGGIAAVEFAMHRVWEAKVARGLERHVYTLLAHEYAARGPFGFVLPVREHEGGVRWVGVEITRNEGFLNVACCLSEPVPIRFFVHLGEERFFTQEPGWQSLAGLPLQDIPTTTLQAVYHRMQQEWQLVCSRLIPPIATGVERYVNRRLFATHTWGDYVTELNRTHGYADGVLFSSAQRV